MTDRLFPDIHPVSLRRMAEACGRADDQGRAAMAAMLLHDYLGWDIPRWALRYIDWTRLARELEAEARMVESKRP